MMTFYNIGCPCLSMIFTPTEDIAFTVEVDNEFLLTDYDKDRDSIWAIRFQAYPVDNIRDILSDTWVKREDLDNIDFFEDILIYLLAGVSGSELCVARGFQELLHFGQELNNEKCGVFSDYQIVPNYKDKIKVLENLFNFEASGVHDGIADQNRTEFLNKKIAERTFLTYVFSDLFNEPNPRATGKWCIDSKSYEAIKHIREGIKKNGFHRIKNG